MIKFVPLVLAGLAGLITPLGLSAKVYETRYGSLKTDDLNLLFFRDTLVRPKIEGNNFLTFEKKFEFPGYDLVLVQDVGGTACPALFYVVKVSRRGAVGTQSFGTCSIIYQVNRTGDGLEVRMGGFMGPFEGRASQSRAARKKFSYHYVAGKIVERRIR